MCVYMYVYTYILYIYIMSINSFEVSSEQTNITIHVFLVEKISSPSTPLYMSSSKSQGGGREGPGLTICLGFPIRNSSAPEKTTVPLGDNAFHFGVSSLFSGNYTYMPNVS